MEQLNKNLLQDLSHDLVKESAEAAAREIPVKILQFGTGGFIRAFADYLVDKANKKGLFNGRIVVVKSTPGSPAHFNEQDQLYTINIKDQQVYEYIVSSAISKVVSARDEWPFIVQTACDPSVNILISNTTEAGLQLGQYEAVTSEQAPASFPGKITALLYARFRALGGGSQSGTIVLPCELVVSNGDILKDMVLKLAGANNLPAEFISWINDHNTFCNTIVDRIVPGKPGEKQLDEHFQKLGYRDDLFLEAEPYLLWGIEGDESLKEKLPFAQADKGVIIAKDIEPYREQKLRLLNGTHTAFVPVAFLCGLETVDQSAGHPLIGQFIQDLMQEEIAPTLEGISPSPKDYAAAVFRRFGNPYIDHKLISITFQQGTKMKLRNKMTIGRYFKLFNKAPERLALGFAAFILFMKSEQVGGKYQGMLNGASYPVTDELAGYFHGKWKEAGELTATSAVRLVDEIITEQEYLDDPEIKQAFAAKAGDFLFRLSNKPAIDVLKMMNV